jgi:transposase-like protein
LLDRSDPIFSDEDAARRWLEARRWPDGVVCPWCDRRETVRPLGGNSMGDGWHHCRDCRRKFTVRVGTLYERSHVPLHKWLLAAHILSTGNPKAVTAERLGAALAVSYRTAWRLIRRLRAAQAGGEMPLQPEPDEPASATTSSSASREAPDAGF